jgi:hypothetical protein
MNTILPIATAVVKDINNNPHYHYLGIERGSSKLDCLKAISVYLGTIGDRGNISKEDDHKVVAELGKILVRDARRQDPKVENLVDVAFYIAKL